MDSSGSLATLSDSEFERLAAAAIAAPSADNSQPWRIARHAEGLVIGLQPQRTPSFFDFDGWAGAVSLGAAAENVLQTAPGAGLDAAVVPLDETTLLIRMRRMGERRPAPFEQAVAGRHTNRGRFRSTPVAQAVRDRLVQSLADMPAFRLQWATSPQQRQRVVCAVRQAEWVRFTHPQIHAEFHESLRFGPAQERQPDGLAADTLGIERALMPALRLLRPWRLASALNRLGLHHVMVWRGATFPLGQAPLIGLLTASGDSSGIACGRALERLWLAAESAGVALQSFGALPLLLRRLHSRPTDAGYTTTQRERLLRADRAWREAIAARSEAEALVMIVRVGYAASRVPRSRRRPLETFVIAR